MNKHLKIFLLLAAVAAASCNRQPEEHVNNERTGKGGVIYGGTFRFNQTEQYESLYPHRLTDLISSTITRQMHEGLVRMNPQTLAVEPALAESWEIDETGTIYTFHLRKDAYFHDDPCFEGGKGRAVTAEDVRYSFTLLCTKSRDNINFGATFKDRLSGANAHYEAAEGHAGSPEGIEVVDAGTVRLKLVKPFPSFLYILTLPSTVVMPKEAIQKYGIESRVGTGAFVFSKEIEYPRTIILTRNPNYFRSDTLGNRLPFLDSIVISFLTTKEAELGEFLGVNLDMAYELPSKSIKEVVENNIRDFQGKPPKYVLDRTSSFSTQYYEFNLGRDVFRDRNVRMALSHAIDKKKIVENVLKEQAWGPAVHGFTPPNLEEYDISQFSSPDYNPEEARKLLAQAGYPGGKNFPTIKLELNTGGARHASVALEVQKQLLEVLNVNVELEVVPFPKKLEDQQYGRADMFRAGWIADYPSPETFMVLFYGRNVPGDYSIPSHPNTMRYRSEKFDALYEQAMATPDTKERNRLFADAEKTVLADVPGIPLWYEENYLLLQANVKGFHNNPLRYLDFSSVYLSARAPVPGAAEK